MCRIDIQKRGFNKEINDNRDDSLRSKGGCHMCDVFLCRKGDCVKRFHDRGDIMEPTE